MNASRIAVLGVGVTFEGQFRLEIFVCKITKIIQSKNKNSYLYSPLLKTDFKKIRLNDNWK